MIRYVRGDLFESPAQTLVNTVNTVGVMGKGIALTFKKLYPEMFAAYQRACEEGRFKIGSLFLWRTPTKLIINLPTKQQWRKPSRPEYIEAGLAAFVANYQEIGVRSVSFPPLGCGNGELDFATQVRPLMEEYLSPLPIPVFIYPPLARQEKPEHSNVEEIRSWLRQEPWTLPFSEFWADLKDLLDRRRIFRTLAKGTRIEAKYCEGEPPRIKVKVSGKTYTFTDDEVRELWRELRDHMLVTPKSFPMREKDLPYLLPILAELQYMDVIRLADSYDRLASPTYGLRPVPANVGQKQRELTLA